MKTSCLVFVFALAASANPVEKSQFQNYAESCPQAHPKILPVKTVLSPSETRGKTFTPEVTVLHRCSLQPNCCTEGTPAVLYSMGVYLPFRVQYQEDIGEHHKGDWETQHFTLDNHTNCGCQ